MTDNIYFTSIIKKSIIIEPKKQHVPLQDTIHSLIKQEFEGKCIEEGFIKSGSTHIIKRSLLKTVPNNFGANMYVDVRFKAEVCRPVKGNIIECTVEKINKMGLLATSGPLSVVIPRNFHSNKDAFKDIDIKSVIQIEVIGSRFEINWDHIDVIAKLYSHDNPKLKKKKTTNTNTDEIKVIDTPDDDDAGVDLLDTVSDNGGGEEDEEEEGSVGDDGEDDDIIVEDVDEDDGGGDGDEDATMDGGGGAEEVLDEEVVDDEGNMIGANSSGAKDATQLLEDSDEEEEDDISELTDDNNDNDDDGGGDDGDYGDEGI